MDDLISREAALAAIEKRASDELADANHNYLMGFQDAAEAVQSIPAAMRWMPVSERLPDKPARYLVTNSRWGEFEVDWNIWTGSRWLYNGKPIAWMPLPTAFEGDNNEVDA